MPYSRPGYMKYVPEGPGVAVLHGAPVAVGKRIGVAVKQKAPNPDTGLTNITQIAVGEAFAVISKGVVTVDSVAGANADVLLYIDATNTLTTTSAGNKAFGTVVETAGQRGVPTGKVRVDLDVKA